MVCVGPGRVFGHWSMARVSEDGEPDIPLIAQTDGISPAAGRRIDLDDAGLAILSFQDPDNINIELTAPLG